MKLATQKDIDQILIDKCASEMVALVDKYRFAAAGMDGLEDGYTFSVQASGGNGDEPDNQLDIEACWPIPGGREARAQHDTLLAAMKDPRADSIRIEDEAVLTKIGEDWRAL